MPGKNLCNFWMCNFSKHKFAIFQVSRKDEEYNSLEGKINNFITTERAIDKDLQN